MGDAVVADNKLPRSQQDLVAKVRRFQGRIEDVRIRQGLRPRGLTRQLPPRFNPMGHAARARISRWTGNEWKAVGQALARIALGPDLLQA